MKKGSARIMEGGPGCPVEKYEIKENMMIKLTATNFIVSM